MEFINKIELCGFVGNVTINTIGGITMARFSLCVDNAYKDGTGNNIIEVTWFNCTAWQQGKIKDLSDLRKGSPVHIKGRVRVQQYTDSEGNKSFWEVICKELEVLPE